MPHSGQRQPFRIRSTSVERAPTDGPLVRNVVPILAQTRIAWMVMGYCGNALGMRVGGWGQGARLAPLEQ